MSVLCRCAFCGGPIDPADQMWRRVIGWERKASAESRRGGSDIVFREPLDEYAHDACVQLEKAGVSVAQVSLL
jgi:hypothetical protein